MAQPGSITSEQLKQILELNSKSIEIYLEVSDQYDELLKISKKTESNLNDVIIENKIYREQVNSKVDNIMKEFSDNKSVNKETAATLYKIDSSILKQNIAFSGSVVVVILTLLAKFLFGV